MSFNPFTVIEHEIVYLSKEHSTSYNSFPNAVLTPDGRLVVAFRQARDMRHVYGETRHLDPCSRAVTLTSHDEGASWAPLTRVLYDHFIYGTQDPCLNLLSDGTILASFFQWNVLSPEDAGEKRLRDLEYYGRWIGRPVGLFTSRSVDGGQSWDEPVKVDEDPLAVRGKGVELPDGSFVLAAYKYLPSDMHIMKTRDKGLTWEELAVVKHPHGCDEPFLHRTPSGKLVAFIRSDWFDAANPRSAPLLTAESIDGGHTWSEPVERPFYTPGPFDALRLQSGKVLVTWGRRFPPYGIRAILLDSECADWENAEEIVLRDNCEDEDIGYTSSVQLKNGDIKTFYYYLDSQSGGYAHIACTTYREAEMLKKEARIDSPVRELVTV